MCKGLYINSPRILSLREANNASISVVPHDATSNGNMLQLTTVRQLIIITYLTAATPGWSLVKKMQIITLNSLMLATHVPAISFSTIKQNSSSKRMIFVKLPMYLNFRFSLIIMIIKKMLMMVKTTISAPNTAEAIFWSISSTEMIRGNETL